MQTDATVVLNMLSSYYAEAVSLAQQNQQLQGEVQRLQARVNELEQGDKDATPESIPAAD